MRPLVSVFLPDRLELVKGPPALRRAHLDQLVAALWPARAAHAPRVLAGAGPAQRAARAGPRRARLARVARRPGTSSSRATASRCATTAPARSRYLDARFAAIAGRARARRRRELRYRPRSEADDGRGARRRARRARSTPTSSAASPATARTATSSLLLRDGRELRVYGSQGEQRLALLALLLAEREALAEERGAPPLLLLDDVMSELDAERRERARRAHRRPRARA